MNCFNEKMGTNHSDEQIYKILSMDGGISFTREKSEYLLADEFNLFFYETGFLTEGVTQDKLASGCDLINANFWQNLF